MDIRHADLLDASKISLFVSELASRHIGPTLGLGGTDKLLASMDRESTITRMTDGYPHWVALDGDALVGVAVVKPPSHIYHLFVRSDQQRNGIGRLLLNEALRFISEDPNAGTITVNSSLNAVGAYRRFGFEDSAEAVDDGGVRYVPMAKTISAKD